MIGFEDACRVSSGHATGDKLYPTLIKYFTSFKALPTKIVRNTCSSDQKIPSCVHTQHPKGFLKNKFPPISQSLAHEAAGPGSYSSNTYSPLELSSIPILPPRSFFSICSEVHMCQPDKSRNVILSKRLIRNEGLTTLGIRGQFGCMDRKKALLLRIKYKFLTWVSYYFKFVYNT